MFVVLNIISDMNYAQQIWEHGDSPMGNRNNMIRQVVSKPPDYLMAKLKVSSPKMSVIICHCTRKM